MFKRIAAAVTRTSAPTACCPNCGAHLADDAKVTRKSAAPTAKAQSDGGFVDWFDLLDELG